MIITVEQLKKIVPTSPLSTLNKYIGFLNDSMELYQINTKARICAFISQLAHESGGFVYVQEIASGSAYEGRKDLGNTSPGDGVKYKGRGLIQITGKINYQDLDKDFKLNGKLVEHPELLETPELAVKSATWYWNSRSLNSIADKPEDWTILYKGIKRTKFEWITIKINGGLNGYAERLAYYNTAKKVIS